MTEGEITNAILDNNPALRPFIAIIPDNLLEILGYDGEAILRADVATWLNNNAEGWALKIGPYYEPEGISPDAELRAFDIRWVIEFSSMDDLERFRQRWKSENCSRSQQYSTDAVQAFEGSACNPVTQSSSKHCSNVIARTS